jgi:Transposase IS66 family
VLYRYSPDRRAEHPKAHLGGFRGVLQADGPWPEELAVRRIQQAGGIMLLFITSRLTGFGSAILRMWTAGRWFARASVSFLMVSII